MVRKNNQSSIIKKLYLPYCLGLTVYFTYKEFFFFLKELKRELNRMKPFFCQKKKDETT